jgi:hypothetical protein
MRVAFLSPAHAGAARFVGMTMSAAIAFVIPCGQTSALADDASDLVAGYSYSTTCALINTAQQASLALLKKDGDKSHSAKASEQIPDLYRYSLDKVSILYLDEAQNISILQAELPLDLLPAEVKSSIADFDHAKKFFQVKDAAKTEGVTAFSCDAVNLTLEYDNKRTRAIKIVNESGAD